MIATDPKRQLFTVRQFAERHPHLTESSLRWQVYRAADYGLEPAIRRIGRRVLIDEAAYFRALDRRLGAA